MIPFPEKRYRALVVDPPWQYRNKNTGGSMKSGASAKYPTMSLEEICALPVPNICERDAVLFLWGTTPLAEYPFEVMKAWKFKYKTKIYWHKTGNLGLGNWFRGQVEECLVCVRGDVKAFHLQKPNFIQSKAREHSRKPEEFFQLIGPAVENINPKIELFARERRTGWDCWGYGVQE